MKEIGILTGKLLLICALVAAALAGVNMVTEPIIAANDQKAFEASMVQVLPQAQTFQELEDLKITPPESGVKVESVYAAKSGDSVCGYVVSTVCAEGYGGDVSVMVGITRDMQVNQAKIMSMSETPGLGARAQEPAFLDQYQGKSGKLSVVKNTTAGDREVEAISGATITSKAVTKAINAALEAAQKGGESA